MRHGTARSGSGSACPRAHSCGARPSWRSSAPQRSFPRAGAGPWTSTATCASIGRRRYDRPHHPRGAPRGLRVHRARDARHPRPHRLLVHPLRGRGLLLRAHGRVCSDRGHVQGTGPSVAHRAHRLVHEGGGGEVRRRHPPGRHLPAQRPLHGRHAPQRRGHDLPAPRGRQPLRLSRRSRSLGRRGRDEPALPDGRYRYEAHLESGRVRLEPLTVRAAVTVAGETITVDLTGTSPQTAGPTNVGPAMAPTGAFTVIKSFLDPGTDVNSGSFRPLTVITPPGTIVNANSPAPCGGMVEVKYCVETAVMGALAQALDGRVAGDHKGGGNHCYVGGPDPRTGETFIFYEYPAGGTGGFEGGDGNNAVRTWTESDMTTLQPIEAVEQLYPLRVERTALRDDSGGAGRWRGGLGLVREVRIHAPASQLSVLAERAVLPPFGVCGGGAGATNRFWVRRNDQPIQPSALPGKISGFPIQPEDLLIMESSGGGGFGDALDRDLESVARDLAEGYVSPAAAEASYGVVSRAGVIDAAATAARRASLREARIRVRLATGRDLDEGRGRAIRLDADTAARLGVGLQAVVELVNPQGAPLRP